MTTLDSNIVDELQRRGFTFKDGRWQRPYGSTGVESVTDPVRWYEDIQAPAKEEAEKKALQDKFEANTIGRGEAILKDPTVAAAMDRLTAYQGDVGQVRDRLSGAWTGADATNTAAIAQNQSILDEYRGKALERPMYRGDTILNDTTSKAALDRLLAISGGEGLSGDGGVSSMFTDQTAANAAAQADRLRQQAQLSGMTMDDPAFQSKLTGIETQRQQANNAARAQVEAGNAPIRASAAAQVAQQRLAQTLAAQQADMNWASQVNNQEQGRAAQLANMGGNIFNQGLQAQGQGMNYAQAMNQSTAQQAQMALGQGQMRLGQQAAASPHYQQAAAAFAQAQFSKNAGAAGYATPPMVQASQPVQAAQMQANPSAWRQTPSIGWGPAQDLNSGNTEANRSGFNTKPATPAKPAASQAQAGTPHDAATMGAWAAQQTATPHDAATMEAWAARQPKAKPGKVI